MKSIARTVAFVMLFSVPIAADEPEKVDQTTEVKRGAADASDFDYLLGDWTFTAVSKQWGRFEGLWSAVKLAEGQILDEYRVIGDDGETLYVTTTLRNLNQSLGLWDLVGADGGHGLRDVGTARRVGGEVRIEQTFGASSESPSIWRIRYHSITTDRFLWAADRSTDGGTSWVRDFQTIEARRTGSPRHLPRLTPSAPSIPRSPGK